MTKLWLIGAGVLLGALLIAAVTVALLEQEDTLPEGSPEAAVQSFLLSLENEDFGAAYDYLSADLKKECKIDDLFGRSRGFGRQQDDRITLEGTTIEDETAFVTVRRTQFRGSGPFGASESSHEERFVLIREEGSWKFKDPFMYGCGPLKPFPAVAPLPESRPAPAPAPTAEPAPKPTPSSGGASQ